MNEELILKFQPFIKLLNTYHDYQVLGLENIPKKGPCIVAFNHSLATYDIFLLMNTIIESYNRFPRSLIDNLFYKVPGLGDLMGQLGCVAGKPNNAESLLSNGEIVFVAPGGMKESLRPSRKKYEISWAQRRGFARLAMKTGTPIVLAACPAADDIFHVYESEVSKWFYKNLKVPLFLARGIGLTPIPKPARLTHLISEPMLPPSNYSNPENALEDYHSKLVNRMKQLINAANQNQYGTEYLN